MMLPTKFCIIQYHLWPKKFCCTTVIGVEDRLTHTQTHKHTKNDQLWTRIATEPVNRFWWNFKLKLSYLGGIYEKKFSPLAPSRLLAKILRFLAEVYKVKAHSCFSWLADIALFCELAWRELGGTKDSKPSLRHEFWDPFLAVINAMKSDWGLEASEGLS